MTALRTETTRELHAAPETQPETRRPRGKHRWLPYVVVSALYLLVSLCWFRHLNSFGSSHLLGPASSDDHAQIWWLAWTADNLPHVSKLLHATGQNYPFGANFGVNGSMLALGVLFAPITKLFGVSVTWNLALRLAPVVSAGSMCFVLRRWTTWWPAAFLGGLLYGFSSYQTHLADYLFLVFVPLPPVFFLLLHEILVRQKWSPRTTGLLLGLVCVLQFFIFTEVLAGMVMVGAIAVLLYVAMNARAVRERWRYMRVAFAYGIGLAAILLIYPLAFTLTGPQHIHGPPDATLTPVMRPDVYGLFYPIGEWLGPSSTGINWVSGYVTAQLYVGIPLLVLVALAVVVLRKNRTVPFAALMAFITFVLSLGPSLLVNGRLTGIPLPFAAVRHVPELNGFQPSRLSLYTFLFLAVILAIAVDEVWRRARAGPILVEHTKQLGFRSNRGSVIAGIALVSLMAAVLVLPLIPKSSPPSIAPRIPTFFTSRAIDAVPRGSVLLEYPYPDREYFRGIWFDADWGGYTQSALLDQAAADMRFQLIGGYGWFPAPITRAGTTDPAVLEPDMVRALFDAANGTGTPAERALVSKASKATLANDLRAYLRRYHVQTVVSHHVGYWMYVSNVVSSAIGSPVRSGSTDVWLNVDKRLSRSS